MKINYPLPGDQAALRQLWKDVFSDTDTFLDSFFSAAFSFDHCLCVRYENRIAAAAYWMDCEVLGRKAAYIYAVATADQYRGRGFCRALMLQLHSVLQVRDYSCGILVPEDDGLRRMYGTMGYKDFGGIQTFSSQAGNTAACMRRISKDDFAALRRQYLPERAVIQEGAQLELLDTLADFYQGNNYLLTVQRENHKILEFLGSSIDTPGIVHALGLSSAVFRTAGSTPFAMYYPISEGITPTYFAFAFD